MKVVTIVGARPQFIKAAALSRAIAKQNRKDPGDFIAEILLHTGQHCDYNRIQIFFDQLKIPKPHYNQPISLGNSVFFQLRLYF